MKAVFLLALYTQAFANNCSIFNDPKKSADYMQKAGQQEWMNLMQQCVALNQINVDAMMRNMQALQRQGTQRSMSNNQQYSGNIDNSTNQNHSSDKKIIHDPKDRYGRNCVSMTINRFDELDNYGVDKNWVLYATAKNICDKPMTVIIEENGRQCKTDRIGAGATMQIGCWTYGKDNIRYKWNYNPYW